MKIIGAGLSGLLAGVMNPGSTIYERAPELPNNHGAILRFRSDKISQALGIPFKKVRVTKGIWYDGCEWENEIRFQNMYSHKCTGKYIDRSISNIKPVDRWIAPDDFIQQLAARCEIMFNRNYPEGVPAGKPIISTIPMQHTMKLLGNPIPYSKLLFTMAPIWTETYTLPGADLYQTMYFPDPEVALYRASFTGDKMIMEFCRNPVDSAKHLPFQAFGINRNAVSGYIESGHQKYGKIVDIDPHLRRGIMSALTHEHNIYSLGRYATWRNIILDDVFEDIIKIRDLMKLDSYSRRLKL